MASCVSGRRTRPRAEGDDDRTSGRRPGSGGGGRTSAANCSGTAGIEDKGDGSPGQQHRPRRPLAALVGPAEPGSRPASGTSIWLARRSWGDGGSRRDCRASFAAEYADGDSSDLALRSCSAAGDPQTSESDNERGRENCQNERAACIEFIGKSERRQCLAPTTSAKRKAGANRYHHEWRE